MAMSEAQPVPVNALFGSDFCSQLILLMTTDTIDEAAQKVAHHVVGKRIAPQDRDMAVYYGGRRLPGTSTVGETGIAPLQNVFVDYV
jgi:toluene monooxygenase system protein B